MRASVSSYHSKLLVFFFLLTGFLVMFFSSSIKSVYQVYFISICSSFGLHRAVFSWSGATFMLVTGVGSWFAGMLSDKWGAERTILVGTFLAGIAFVAASIWDNFSSFIFFYGAVAAIALASMQYVPMGMLVDKIFSNKNKGMAYVLLTNGTGLGFIVLSPFWVYLNEISVWQTTFFWLGLFFLIPLPILVGLGFFWKRTSPIPPPPQPYEESSDARLQIWKGAFSNIKFWFLAISFFGCGVNMAFIDVHYVPLMQDASYSPWAVSLALSLLGGIEMVGGFFVGWIQGRMSPALLLSLLYFLRALSGFILWQAQTPLTGLLFSALFGVTYLGTVIVTSLFCLKIFNAKLIRDNIWAFVFYSSGCSCALNLDWSHLEGSIWRLSTHTPYCDRLFSFFVIDRFRSGGEN